MSSQEPIVVIGAGGHAKVCIEVLRAEKRYTPIGCVDPGSDSADVLGVPIRYRSEGLEKLYADGIRSAFVALGDNALRARLGNEVEEAGFTLVNAISPFAMVSPTARLGRGILAMPGAVVNAEAEIGDLAIVNTGAVVEHDCRLGFACHVAPGTVLAGRVIVGDRAFVGAGCAIKPGVVIGSHAVVGTGAAVVHDVPPRATVVGVPARQLVKQGGVQ